MIEGHTRTRWAAAVVVICACACRCVCKRANERAWYGCALVARLFMRVGRGACVPFCVRGMLTRVGSCEARNETLSFSKQ